MRKKDKTPKICRGDIYFFDFDPVLGSEQGGTRPAAVLQNNAGNRNAPTVIIAPITSQVKPMLPTHVELPHINDLRDGSILLLEQIRTVDRQRMGQYVGAIGTLTMKKVDEAVLISLAVGSDKEPARLKGSLSALKNSTEQRVAARGSYVSTASSVKKAGKNIATLCPVCKNEYLDAGYHLIKRSSSSSVKEVCGKCNFRTGFDYEVMGR
jgi:mRNA interferase MazF